MMSESRNIIDLFSISNLLFADFLFKSAKCVPWHGNGMGLKKIMSTCSRKARTDSFHRSMIRKEISEWSQMGGGLFHKGKIQNDLWRLSMPAKWGNLCHFSKTSGGLSWEIPLWSHWWLLMTWQHQQLGYQHTCFPCPGYSSANTRKSIKLPRKLRK